MFYFHAIFLSDYYCNYRPNIRPNIRPDPTEYSVSADTNFEAIGRSLKIRQNVVIKASELKAKKIRTGRGNGHTLHINTYEGRSLRQKS